MMQSMVFSLDEIQDAARLFVDQMGESKVFAFYGEMGAGKTTFIRSVCELLGVKSSVNSPTFAIINEYRGQSGPIYHFDFYRIKNVGEAFDIGTEDYFYGGSYCFIEWPEKIEELLPSDCCRIEIRATDDGKRCLSQRL